jgi:signal transduction histidine kinase
LETASELCGREVPQAILAEDRSLAGCVPSLRQRRQALAAALSLLGGYAPVVWIGGVEDGAEICPMIPPGTAEFVPRSALCLTAAVSMVERRLRLSGAGRPQSEAHPEPRGRSISMGDLGLEGRDFGELLRHELNNPLTGILGNAELLLLEVRRGRIDLPPHNLQRLEIIAELAVRMRETVRQLSDRWNAAGGNLTGETPPSAGEPQWPFSG